MARLRSCLFIAALFAGCGLEAAELPLYELGIGAGVFHVPDYPGANHNQTRTLGLPFGIYRGEWLRADRGGGLRGLFLSQGRTEVDISVSGAFPANSQNNPLRRGMPDLDWIGEIGPRLVYNLHDSPESGRLNLTFPVRWAFSTDFTRLDHRGWLFNPGVNYWIDRWPFARTGFSFTVRSSWATEALMDYFYEVSSRFATAERPRYDAQPGYLGSSASAGLVVRTTRDVWLFTGVQFGYFGGVKNRHSTLLASDTNLGVAMALVWRLYESEARAYRPMGSPTNLDQSL